MLDALAAAGATNIDPTWDRKNSISSEVVRCIFEGRRAAAVAADRKAEVQIKSLLDVVELHLVDAPAGGPVAADEVTVLIQDSPRSAEVRDALATLISEMRGGPDVRVLLLGSDGDVQQLELTVPAFDTAEYYPRWPGLMKAAQQAGAPQLLDELWEDLDHGAFRAYPMLTGFPYWSLRVEGLEVGRVRDGYGWLDVGKPGRDRDSDARSIWVGSSGFMGELFEFGPDTIKQASYAIRNFAWEWNPDPTLAGQGATLRQNEHALESRILRGAGPVTTSNGDELSLLAEDHVINWGSQFPTRWGRVRSKSARYLDGLMKHGDTPWALEMKVEGGSGVGRYYRHAVGQAVLYRHFIRSAKPLHFWFDKYEVDPRKCRAAVVVPEMTARQAWRDRLKRMCDLFDVDLIEVPARFAGLTSLEPRFVQPRG